MSGDSGARASPIWPRRSLPWLSLLAVCSFGSVPTLMVTSLVWPSCSTLRCASSPGWMLATFSASSRGLAILVPFTADGDIDWGALGEAAYVSVVAGIVVLVLAAVAVSSSLRAQETRTEGGAGGIVAASGAVTIACIAGLVAIVAYGIYLLTQ